jgi:ATP-dependent DNA ligase
MISKPMLAGEYIQAKLVFPVLASAKLDGLRGLVHEGQLLSRSLKLIPNKHVQDALGRTAHQGLDGELIAGSPTAPNCMQACTSFFMAQDKIQGDWAFYVFDLHDSDMGFDVRFDALRRRIEPGALTGHIKLWPQKLIANEEELLAYEGEQLALGYEGLILRKPNGEYKHGRSTPSDGLLTKLKRFTDSEAVILGFEEQMENTNEKQTNELGRSKRSTHKAGLVGKGTLGALMVRDRVSGVEFNIGTGMNDGVRAHIWANRDEHLGKFVKYKSFLIGVKELPRHPVFLGFRDARDMS